MAAGVPDVDVDVVAGSVGGGCSVDGCWSVGDVAAGTDDDAGAGGDVAAVTGDGAGAGGDGFCV